MTIHKTNELYLYVVFFRRENTLILAQAHFGVFIEISKITIYKYRNSTPCTLFLVVWTIQIQKKYLNIVVLRCSFPMR